ncbi:MAG: phosphate signaling complex protein PhoU [Thermoguttaceae bacterium]
MSVFLQREIDKLKKSLLSLCALVEEQVQLAVQAALNRDEAMAREIKERDLQIDHLEVELEEECLKTLALHQPVAADLRLIIAALKINNDLERIGDLAVNIARKAASLAAEPPVDITFDLAQMCSKTQAMLRDSLDALVNLDQDLAHSVCARDDEIDAMKHAFRVEIEERVQRNPENTKQYLRLMAISRNLERVADLATNIAEDMIYLAGGKIIRHSEKD